MSFHCRYSQYLSAWSHITDPRIKTYALVESVPYGVHCVIVCPMCSLESCAISPILGIPNVHLECECSAKDETEKDEVSSKESTVYPLQLAPRVERVFDVAVAGSCGEGVNGWLTCRLMKRRPAIERVSKASETRGQQYWTGPTILKDLTA